MDERKRIDVADGTAARSRIENLSRETEVKELLFLAPSPDCVNNSPAARSAQSWRSWR